MMLDIPAGVEAAVVEYCESSVPPVQGRCSWEAVHVVCQSPKGRECALDRHWNLGYSGLSQAKWLSLFCTGWLKWCCCISKFLKASFHHSAFNILLLLSVLSYYLVSPICSLNTKFSFLPFYFHSKWWSHIPHGSAIWNNFPDSYCFWVSTLSLASMC